MIRFHASTGDRVMILVAESVNAYGEWRIYSAELPDHARHLQARLLIDAAAALLEDDADYETEFEALHSIMGGLPTETREDDRQSREISE